MTEDGPFILDSDVFIAAKNAYYSFRICPGFWESLIGLHEAGRVMSIDRVKAERLSGRDTEDLFQWVKTTVPDTFFASTSDAAVAEAYTEVMVWVARSVQFFDAAKAKFATGADGWLVAYSMVYGTTVVTNEQSRPASRNEIKLPDVCESFGVPYQDTFAMLSDLGARYDWAG